MPYQIVTDPKTGKLTTVVTGKVYEPKEGEQPDFQAQSIPSPMDVYKAARSLTPQGMLESGVQAFGQAAGAGIGEFQRSGDFGKALQAGGTAYGKAMEQPAMLAPRVGYNAARDLAQSVLGNLPAAGSRRPGQADSPILGVLPPLPRFKSTGQVEDVATGLLQGAMAWIPAARVVGLAARGAAALPGVAGIAQGARTAASFAKGAGPVVPLLPGAPTVGRLAVGVAKASLSGAPTGALVDVAAFTPNQQTTVGSVLDWVEKQSGTPLYGPLTDLLKTKPGDTEANARWKEAVGGAMVIGPAVGNAIEAVGYLARAVVNRAAVSTKAAPAVEPPPVDAAPMRQANVDVAAERQRTAQANVDAFEPKPDPADKKAVRSWNRRYKPLAQELAAANAALTEAKALQQPVVPAPAVAAKPDQVAAAEQAVQEATSRVEEALREMAQPPAAAAAPEPSVPSAGTPRPAAAVAPAAPVGMEIPAAASRKITTKTSGDRVQIAAESLLNWTSTGVPGEQQAIRNIDQALELVRAKGAILDPDKVPGLSVDDARSDKAMGRNTANTEAVAAVYRQFYGLEKPAAAAPVPAPAAAPATPAAAPAAPATAPAASAVNRSVSDEEIKQLEQAYPYRKYRGQTPLDEAQIRLEKVKDLQRLTAEEAQALNAAGPEPSTSSAVAQKNKKNWNRNVAKLAKQAQQIERDLVVAQAAIDRLRQAPAAKAELPDTRGQGEFYHGAAQEFDLTPGGEYGGTGMNIYGNGFYSTEDLQTAASYQKKNISPEPIITMYGASDELGAMGKATPAEINGLLGRGKSKPPSPERIQEISSNLRAKAKEFPGNNKADRALELADTLDAYKPVDPKAGMVIYKVTENQPIKFYDLDQQVDPGVVAKLQASAGYDQAKELVDAAIDDAGPKASLAQIMDEMRRSSKSFEIPAYEVQDIWENLIDELKKEGYGGFTHQGGKLAGGGQRLHQVRIYWDPAESITLTKVEPGAPAAAAPTAAAPTPTPPVAAAGPNLAEIRQLDDTLAKSMAGKSPEERAIIRDQMLAQKYGTGSPAEPPAAPAAQAAGGGGGTPPPPEPPRPPDMPAGPEDPQWAQRWAELTAANKDKLASGEITLEDLHRLNTYQKLQSPSGNQVYTADTEDLAAGMAAMAQTTPDIAARTGFESLNVEERAAFNQQWFNRHGMDWGKNYEDGLRGLDEAMVNYELGTLNRAMSMADKKMVEAQYAGARWLNSVAEPSVNASEQLAQLVTAANSAQRMLLVIDRIRRRWGQLGQEMQMRRNYDIPEQGSGLGVVETAIRQELDTMPDAFDGLTSKLDPELTTAAQGGEVTPNAEAAADALAQAMVSLGNEPKARLKLWNGLLDATKPIEPNGFLMLRSNNLISSGVTAATNLGNALFNLGRLTQAQMLGAGLHADFDRAIYAAQMWGTQFSQIGNALRLAGHAFKAGQSLFNLEGSTMDAFARIAKQDAMGDQMLTDPKAMTGWSVNTWNMSNEFAQTKQGQLVNKLWQVVGTGASRLAMGLDTFNSVLSGYSYERFRHMPRGMDLAVERGLPKFSSEAWAYANKYADARTEQAIMDVIINGKTLADAAIESPHAKKFMDAVNFTDDVYAQLETRTPDEGYRIGKTKGLEGQELDDFARKYVDEGLWYHRLGEWFVTPDKGFGSGVVGRIGSAPGLMLEGMSSVPVAGPVVRFVQPFQRVPSNILKSIMRSTPAAAFVDTWWRDVLSNDVGTRQRAIGEMAMGSAALTMLTLATTMGYIRFNGGGPVDPRAKEKWLKERQMPYSFQFWDADQGRWEAPVSMRAMEPFATLFGAIGDYADHAASMPTETRNRAGGALLMSLVRMQTSGLLSKTYFQGITELYEAAFDPSKVFTGPAKRDPLSRFLQRVLASMVPYSSALRAARRQVDPYARTVEPSEGGWMGFWQETWDEIRNATPGLSQDLPALRDWTLPGAPPMVLPQIAGSGLIPEDAPFLQALWQFTPMAAAPVGRPIEDPVQQEMFNLHGKGSIFSGPRASDFGPEMRLTPKELASYQELFASVRDAGGLTWHDTVSKLIQDPNYVALPDQPPSTQEVSYRAAAIQREIMRFKELAKAEFKATTAKGQEIQRNELKLQGQRDEMNYYQRYGVPGAARITGPEAFIQEMNP